MDNIRLNKFISQTGFCSRRKADLLIEQKRVKINGNTAAIGDKVNKSDHITIDDQAISLPTKLHYFVLYKPKNVITTMDDEQDRESIKDYFPPELNLFPVGRLDRNSEGLIILTNDGDFANELAHPSFNHKKIYEVWARKSSNKNNLNEKDIKKLMEKGFKIDGVLMKADMIEFIKYEDKFIKFNIILSTGFNRQIRKMCDKIGYSAIKLIRTKIGNLDLKDLKIKTGECLEVKKGEII